MFCREIGRQISELSADNPDFDVFGVVKETGVDDQGLTGFHNQYFDFPLYRDVNLATYAALGNKSILVDLSWNPFKLYRGMKKVSQRLKEKGIEGNMVGEGLKKGGVFILNSRGEIQAALEEATGTPVNVEELQAALDAVREGSLTKVTTSDL